MRPLRSLMLYMLAVLLATAVLAPGVKTVADWAGHHIPLLAPLAALPFARVVHRLLELVALLGLWPLLRSLNMRTWHGVGLVRPAGQWSKLGWGFAVGFGSLAVVAALALVADSRRVAISSHWAPSVFEAAWSAAAIALVEEILFRGALLGALRQAHPWRVALAMSSGVYALVHFLQRPPETGPVTWSSGFVTLGQMFRGFLEFEALVPGFLTLTLAGLILGLAYQRTGNLYASMGLHAGWVFWRKSYVVLTDAQPGASPWFWGSAKLFDGWLALIALAALFVSLVLFWNRPAEPPPPRA